MLISVIVPVYKVEQYLNQCLLSIVNQSYRDLEIILVDDGSPDNCSNICDEWAVKDHRIKVIHKENGGLSDARNAGILAATGEYIGFVDGDDWISPNMYEVLLHKIQEDDCDIAIGGVLQVWDDNAKTQRATIMGNIILNNYEAMKALIEESWIKQPVWNKLYKTDMVKQIPFKVGKIHEDVFWTYRMIAQAQKVSVTDEVVYYYRQRSDSIMGTPFSESRIDGLEALEERFVFIKEHYPKLTELTAKQGYFYVVYLAQWALRSHRLDAYNKIAGKRYLFLEAIHNKNVWVCASQISFKGVCIIRNVLKRGV